MMNRCRARILGFGLVAMIAGCTKPELVVLLPESDGSVGQLAVTSTAGSSPSLELTEAFAAARTGGGAPRAGQLSLAEIEARFGDVTGILPLETQSYTLYFESGQSTLSADDLTIISDIQTAIAFRSAAELEVVGHTDTVGPSADNDQLSIERAARARDVLIVELGLSPDQISTSGRGERQLAEPTADDVPNARNRRVELRLR